MTLVFAPERIGTRPLSRLQPYARNAKGHGADQVAKIAASMAEFGWTVPCLVSKDGELITGHGRVLAATQLGLSEAPVILLGHLTEAQRRAYRIADNRLAESPWNEALLPAELQGLLAGDFDLSLIGFSGGELDKLLSYVTEDDGAEGGAGGSVPPGDHPKPPRNTASQTGDLQIVENHRPLCGDSTNHDHVARGRPRRARPSGPPRQGPRRRCRPRCRWWQDARVTVSGKLHRGTVDVSTGG